MHLFAISDTVWVAIVGLFQAIVGVLGTIVLYLVKSKIDAVHNATNGIVNKLVQTEGEKKFMEGVQSVADQGKAS